MPQKSLSDHSESSGRRLPPHKIGSFEPDILENIPTQNIEENIGDVRVLGQKRNLKNDTFIMKRLTYFPTDAIEYTQRKIFNIVCLLFDPLGFLPPLPIRFKILLRKIGKLCKKRDEPLPVQKAEDFRKY